MSAKDMHSKGTHSLIGLGAIILGVVLGIGVVYWDGSNKELAVQAQAVNADCTGDPGYTYPQKNPKTGVQGLVNKPCTEPDGVGGTCKGLCKVTGQCVGVSCNNKKLEGKPKEMPKEMGGMPPMLPMPPMSMPKPDMPKEPEDPCKTDASSTECQAKRGTSGIGNYLSNLFGTNSNASSTGGTIQTAVQSVASKLNAFLSGDSGSEASTNTNTNTQNPTSAFVTPVIGSNVGKITAQTGAQGSVNAGATGGPTNVAVTGFGSGGANVETSAGPILAAIKSVTARIQEILSSLF